MDTVLVRDYIASYLKKNPPEMIKRDLSVGKVRGKATVIIGPRRAGKTYFLWQEILKYDRSETLYLDFEDIALMDLKPSEILLLIKDIFTEISSKSVKVLFLDEIQNVVGWESLVRSLLDRGYILFITGSSSKLLSKEIATQLRGRSLSYLLLPFSFKEFLTAEGVHSIDKNSLESVGKIKGFLDKYLRFGGYPEVVLNPENRDKILVDYKDLIFLKDFVEREKIKSMDVGRFIFSFITQAFSSEISYMSVLRSLKAAGIRFGKNTVYDYIGKLQDTMVFFFLDKYSTKVRQRSGWPKKVYLADAGLAWRLPYDEGRLIENVVFLELKRRGVQSPDSEIYYYRDEKGHEVDFMIKGSSKILELIQVTFGSSRQDIRNTEISNLITASKSLKCENLTVVTWDYKAEEEVDGKKIKFVPLWRWLLNL